jgi:hypothetical protein
MSNRRQGRTLRKRALGAGRMGARLFVLIFIVILINPRRYEDSR